MKRLWPAGLVLLVAILIALIRPPNSAVSRLVNLDLSLSEIPDTYLTISKRDQDKAYVADRRRSTIRRSDRNQPGQKWDLFRVSNKNGNANTDTWIVKSKKDGKGTVLFVSAVNIDDWSYPFFYNFVAERNEQLKLQPLSWTQLYVNRVYHGLYLRLSLPFDLRKKDGGSGILREIISVNGNRSYHVNTRLESVPGLYAEKVSESYFPGVADVSPQLLWLGILNNAEFATFIMSNVEPFDISFWPVPVSLPQIFEAQTGTKPSGYLDDRFVSWVPSDGQIKLPFGPEVSKELHSAYQSYAGTLAQAIEINAEFDKSLIEYRSGLKHRQYAAQQLGLELELF